MAIARAADREGGGGRRGGVLPKTSSLVIFEVRYSKLNRFYTYLCHDVTSRTFCFVFFFFQFVSSSKGILFFISTPDNKHRPIHGVGHFSSPPLSIPNHSNANIF